MHPNDHFFVAHRSSALTRTAPLALCTTLAALAVAACGDDTSGDGGGGGGGGGTPVSVSAENLRGYWAAYEPDNPSVRPYLLHFDPPYAGDVAAADSALVAESVGLTLGATIGPVVLSAGGSFELQTVTNGSLGTYAEGQIDALTTDTLDVTFGIGGVGAVKFRRVEGCAAPGLWIPAGFEATDAGWGPDGSLHILAKNSPPEVADYTGYYVWVPPGRCSPYISQLSVVGDSIDVGADGTVRIVNVEPTSVTYIEIAPRPWERDALQPRIVELSTTMGSSYVRATARVAVDTAGRAVVMWPEGHVLHSWSEQADGTFTAGETTLQAEASLTPQWLEVVPDPDGALTVRSRFARAGAAATAGRLRDGVWDSWDVPTHPELGVPSAYAWDPDGRLVAAWETSRLIDSIPLTVVGRLGADGVWSIVEAGPGRPFSMRVDADWIDVASTATRDESPIYWTRVPATLEPSAWRSETVADGSVGAWFATVQSQIGSVYPIARFGSGGEVFLGGQDAQWRFTALEPDEEFEWMPFQVRVEAEAGARVRIPALGVDCNSTCDFLAPPGVTVPLHLEVPAGSVGTYFTGYVEPLLDDAGGDEWAFVAARDRVPNTVTRELIVRGTARDLAVVAGPVPTGDVTGSLVDFDYRSGSWLVATSQQAVSLDAAFAATASAPVSGLEGIAWANPTALGVPEGAVAVAVATLSPGGRSVVWLGPTLEVTASRPIQPFSSTAVTDGGVWELSPGVGGAMALSWHDADGTTSVAQTELADGVVFGDAATAYVLSRGESPSPRALRRYDRDGTLRWELGVRRSGGTTDAVWSIGDDRLYGLFDRENALVAAGTEYPTAGGLSHAVAELDAATGQVVRAREVGAVSIGRIAGGDDGVSVIGASTTSLELTMIGWDATTSVSRSVYDATVVPGHCTDPAVRCTPLPADVMRVSPDELAAAWVFQRPFELDGTSLDAEVPSIAVGVFRPR